MDSQYLAFALYTFFSFLLVFFSVSLLRRLSNIRKVRPMKKGRRMEAKGAVLLQASGYRILKTQPSVVSRVQVGKKVFEKVVRADFLVKKGFRRYIVEVKGGEVVCDPTLASTRRQLFEYYACFQTPRLLFVDALSGDIYKIKFPGLQDKVYRVFSTFLYGFLLGLAVVWFLCGKRIF